MAPKLIAAVGALAAAAGLAVGSSAGPERHGARVVRFTVKSKFAHRKLHEVAVVPAGMRGGERRPMLVFLHGRSASPGSLLSGQFFDGLARLGRRAPVVVALDGGDHSYWHDRRGARWGSYVLREAIPRAERLLPIDRSRVAIGGISMGGYGAYALARGRRFCAVGGHSPAFWLSYSQTAPGAFDSASDFRRHSVYRYVTSQRHPYGMTPLWIDRGDRDPFSSYDSAIVRALRARGARVSSHAWSGGHTGAYWRAHIARYLRWYARQLARC